MNLIGALVAGVRGAENGFVDVYARGTSTRAQQFTTAEGDGAFTPTASTTLDSNGGAVIYVNQPVDCSVKDSGGNVIREFTEMTSSPLLEVRSQSFTGVDYATGVSAAGNPEDWQTVANLWKTQNGAIDWQVLVGGAPVTIQAAFSSVSGLFYNVKASTYGATGLGVADDISAIQAAINAASAAGGGIVFLPGGTYRITTAIDLKAGVCLMGAGASASLIAIDHASNNAIVCAAGGLIFIQDLTVKPLQANTGKLIVAEAAVSVLINRCTIGLSTLTNGTCLSMDGAPSTTRVWFVDSFVTWTLAAGIAILANTGTPKFVMRGCRVTPPATFNGNALFLNGGTSTIIGNTFACGSVTAGTGELVGIAGSFTVTANVFESPAGGSIRPITTTSSNGGNFVGLNTRAQSAFWAVQPLCSVAAQNTTHEGGDEFERATRPYHVTDNTSPITVDPTLYGMAEVRRTNNSNQTINGVTPVAPGQMFTLVLNNDQAGVSGTITLNAVFKGQAPFTVAANNVRSITFRAYESMAAGGASATKYWGFVGSTGDVTP